MAEAMAAPTIIDESVLAKLGQRLQSLFETHEKDRKAAEDKWLKNLRQFRGVYDPDILAMIPSNCSKAYPKVTRWIVIATVARLMSMLFPNTEENWAVGASPLPDLPVDQLQGVLDALVQEKAQKQGVPPEQVRCTDEEIEKAISQHAAGKAERMTIKLRDDLAELDYARLARRVVFSGCLYNVGVLEGPMTLEKKARTWSYDPLRGKYMAREVPSYKPAFEFIPVWQYYPDMTATELNKQDGTFILRVKTRADIEELAQRSDFMGDRIHDWLRKHLSGNHKIRHWETSMKSEKKSDQTSVEPTEARKYDLLSYWGVVKGEDLRAAGVTVKDEDVGKSLQANVWLLDNVVIKARLLPFGTEARIHHEFVFEEDDLSLLGNGQCDTIRDSQLAICESVRAALDNASVMGPQLSVNTDLLQPGHDLTIQKNKVWRREGTGNSAQYDAVKNVEINPHLAELQSLTEMFLAFVGKEAALPPPSMGDVQQGGSEALRTSQNASMFLGAAALPIRDTVRNFDVFTKSVITSLVKWNMKYAPNASRDGDFDIIARGSTSLIAKEVLSQSLDLFKATLTEDEIPHVKTRKLLEHRMKARDLPVDEILEDEDTAMETIARVQQQQQMQMQQQSDLVAAQVEQTLADAFKKVKDAATAEGKLSVEGFTAIIEALANGREQGGKASARSGAASASA